MESVPEYADEVYGLAWRQVFKLRNTVALRYCERYGRRIPEEEFLSGANEAIVEALSSFDATRGAAFASHLWLVLSRKMRAVVEHEWRGHIRRSYRGKTRKEHRRLSQTYTPPEFVEVMPETLSVPCHAEHAVLLREVLTYLATHERADYAGFVLGRAVGVSPTAMQQVSGVRFDSIVHRIAETRARLHAWVEEAS